MMQRIVGRSLMARSEIASMEKQEQSKLGRRSISDRWIPFKILERRRIVRSEVDKKNA
jgi:hypothetical protein